MQIIVFLIVVAIIVAIIWKKKPKIDLNFISQEGKFHVQGKKGKFQIQKGDRFIFNVKDGQIISFVDKSVSNEVIEYKEASHGNP